MSLTINVWLIYLIREDNKREPIGLFFGDLTEGKSKKNWIKGGNAGIELKKLPEKASDDLYRDRLSVLHACDQTVFTIVANEDNLSAVFSGETGMSYSFTKSGTLFAKGKLRVEYGETHTYGGRHSIHIDGIANIIFCNGVVVIQSVRNLLFLNETLPQRSASNQSSHTDGSDPWRESKSASHRLPETNPFSNPCFESQEFPQLEGYDAEDEDLSDRTGHHLNDDWIKEKDSYGTWYMPKTFFCQPFPSIINESTPQKPTQPRPRSQSLVHVRYEATVATPHKASEAPEMPQELRNRWTQQTDELGSRCLPKTLFGQPFPQPSGHTINARIPTAQSLFTQMSSTRETRAKSSKGVDIHEFTKRDSRICNLL